MDVYFNSIVVGPISWGGACDVRGKFEGESFITKCDKEENSNQYFIILALEKPQEMTDLLQIVKEGNS